MVRDLAGILATGVCLVALATPAAAQTRDFNIPPGPLKAALDAYAKQSGEQVIYRVADVRKARSNGVKGAQTNEAALEAVLAGSGLTSRVDGSGAIAIVKVGTANAERAEATTGSLTLSGRIVDSSTGAALKGALVEIPALDLTASTDDLGQFRFPGLRAGEYDVRVSYLGYRELVETLVANRRSGPSTIALIGGSADTQIIVYGQQSARAQALNQERTADNVSTVISSDLMGDFPGQTISEALRRFPAISFQRDAEGTGDGANIIVRGLEPNLNSLKLNGVTLAVGNGTDRSANLGNLLAESIDKVTISKTLLPSQDSAGTGGLIEIESKSPLDRPKNYVATSLEKGWTQNNFSNDLIASGLYSTKFGTGNRVGLSIGAQYRKRTLDNIFVQTSPFFGKYLPLGEDGNTSITTPDEIDPRIPFPYLSGSPETYTGNLGITYTDIDYSNLTVTSSAEALISDSSHLKATVFHARQKKETLQRAFQFSLADLSYNLMPVKELNGEERYALSSSGNIGTIGQFNNLDTGFTQVTTTANFDGESDLGTWTIKYSAGLSFARDQHPSLSKLDVIYTGQTLIDPSFLQPGATDPIEGRVITPFPPNGGAAFPLPLLTSSGFDFYNDASNYVVDPGTVRSTKSTNNLYSGKISVRKSFPSSKLRYIEVGLFSERSKFQNLVTGFSEFGGANGSLSSFGLALNESKVGQIGINRGFNVVDEGAITDLLSGLRPGGGNPSAFGDLLPIALHPSNGQQFTRESTLASYLEAKLDLGNLEIIGGVRINRTTASTSSLVTPFVLFPDFTTLDPETEIRLSKVISQSATATDVLPRIVANFRPRSDFVFRAGYYLSVARPSVGDLSRDKQFTLFLSPLFSPNGVDPLLFVSEGNPDLQPAISHNFDVSAEKYFGNVGALKFGGFLKLIDNLLETNVGVDSEDFEGLVLPDDPIFQDLPSTTIVRRVRPVNNGSSAKIWGIELSAEGRFTFLPGLLSGLGIFANYTFTDSVKDQPYLWNSAPVFNAAGQIVSRSSNLITFDNVPFSSQPRHTGTAALTYSKHGVDGTLSYTFQSKRLNQFTANYLWIYDDADATLDLKLQYRFVRSGMNWRVSLEGQNLLRGPSDFSLSKSQGGVGGVPSYNEQRTYFGGRSIRLGLAANF